MSTGPKSRTPVVFQKLTREQLDQATKQQLIELVLVLQDLVEQLLVQNQLLEARVAELERRLGMDSSNSSKPPSSDPPASKAKRHIGDLLVEGEICGVRPMASVCKRLLAEEDHLWTFVDHEGIEPTNNNAERAVRQGVLWRKVCFGTQS